MTRIEFLRRRMKELDKEIFRIYDEVKDSARARELRASTWELRRQVAMEYERLTNYGRQETTDPKDN